MLRSSPPHHGEMKTLCVSQLTKRLLRIVSPSTSPTCRHSTCASDPGVSTASWKVTPSIRIRRGGGQLGHCGEMSPLSSSVDGPIEPRITLMSVEDVMNMCVARTLKKMTSLAVSLVAHTPIARFSNSTWLP